MKTILKYLITFVISFFFISVLKINQRFVAFNLIITLIFNYKQLFG